MSELENFMTIVGSVTMEFWAVGLMFVIVMVMLLLQMPSVFFRIFIFCILCFWAASVYMVLE